MSAHIHSTCTFPKCQKTSAAGCQGVCGKAYPEFQRAKTRADLCADPALLAEAVEVLRFYADETAWREPPVETVESILGTAYRNKASEIRKDRGNRARAFIAKLENRK